MKTYLPLLLPVSITVLGIVLLQAHSVPFWQEQVGHWRGAAWSFLLELISLWLWLRRGRLWFRPLAWATTLLLLAGPLHQTSQPLLHKLAVLHTEAAGLPVQIRTLRSQIGEAERSLDRYQELSLSGRFGWQGKIDESEALLQGKRNKLAALRQELMESATDARFNWMRLAMLSGQLLSLVIFQASIVLALTAISRHFHEGQPDQKSRSMASGNGRPHHAAAHPDSATGNSQEEAVVALQRAVRVLLRSGKSYSVIAGETGITKRDLSFVMNHFDREKRGERVLGETALRGIEAKLGRTWP